MGSASLREGEVQPLQPRHLPRRLPNSRIFHDSVVAEFAQERNDAVLSPVAAARSPALLPNRKRAAARDERPEAENLLVRQATVGRPASAARADAGDHGLCFDERLVLR